MTALALLVAATATLGGCTQGPGAGHARTALAASEAEWLLPWGGGPGQIGHRAAQPEMPGEGAPAVAVGPNGRAYVLDRLNRRVLVLATPGHPAVAVADVPEDAEDLAVGPDGALAVYSPLRAKVWLRDTGREAGEVTIPRVLREARGILLGESRQVLVHTAYQETYRAGSPAALQSLASVLRSRREGEFLLPTGEGLAVRVVGGQPELDVIAEGERAQVVARHPLPGPALAARVVGLAAGIACVRLEAAAEPSGGEAFTVRRRVACLDTLSGAAVLTRDLPAPGWYVPRRELAMGGSSSPRLAFLHPEKEGLRVLRLAVPRVLPGGKP
jgi:hypothetical protein